ncbi:MAG: hypothetical protein HY869_02765 [Chloroflexi bacterium]|nr:hypothetical protein [Chloroflexota bacterium]
MKMKTNWLAIAILVFGLSACGAPTTPLLEQTISPTTVIISTNTPLPVIPTATSIPIATLSASPTPLLFTDPSIPLSERIVYYYFVTPVETPIPEGSVTISSTYILAPTFSDITYGPNTVDNLRTAFEAVLNDGRNGWVSGKLEIVDISFDDVHANVVLQGEYFGVGDVTLIAASMQILMTVFANPSVQTATVTLNGDTIGNLGISNSMNAKSANYVFTRAEIETFIKEHAYVSP